MLFMIHPMYKEGKILSLMQQSKLLFSPHHLLMSIYILFTSNIWITKLSFLFYFDKNYSI